jgi:hypothetical protein
MTSRIPEDISTWLVNLSAIRRHRETPTMMTRTKKTKRTRTRTKNRRLSENPTNSAAQSRFHQVESLSRSDGFVRFQSRRSNR